MDANKWIGNYYCKSDGSMATNEKIGQYHVGANRLWDGAEANTNPLHIETDFYELDLPASWKDEVSYTTSGNRTYVYLTKNKDCNLFIISANATVGGCRYSGSLDYTNFKIGKTPSGASIYCTINNWPSIVASNLQHGLSYYSKAEYSKLIQLQTNNAISYEQVEDDPEFYIANPASYDYIKNEVLSTAVFHN